MGAVANWYFFYQREGKESSWEMALASDRTKIVKEKKPAFSTVLDLSAVPEDNDWSRVRYRGPLYFDIDAEGDLQLACNQFTALMAKLESEFDLDPQQLSYYASGSKGFHLEIPQECFMPRVPREGTPWLPYVYREIAQSIYVDTLDLKVYTGKRGRQWRTPNVQRENGKYKVPLSYAEALTITPDLYAELISEPRECDSPHPPSISSKFALAFDRAKDKVLSHMRGKKKRQDKAVVILEPWKAIKKTPPTIDRIMQGENLADSAGFQSIAMQLAIYATSVGMARDEFIDRCRPLCENHVSDSSRYNSAEKRRRELSRMYDYMDENTYYDFEVGPIVRLLKKGTSTPDLGVVDSVDHDDTPTPTPTASSSDGDTQTKTEVAVDLHTGVRKGFVMNGDGMFRKTKDGVESICRATMRKVESLVDVETKEFKGYEFDLVVDQNVIRRTVVSPETFTSALKMRTFMAAHQLTYQGNETDTAALIDILAEKAQRSGKVYTYPREGFFVLKNPMNNKEMTKCYLTQDTFISSVEQDSEDYFRLRYRPAMAVSAYNIDIHQAPELNESHIPTLHKLFHMNRADVMADMLGWFVACNYRSIYLHCFSQFPLLHIYGEAGAGKTKSVEVLSRLHWFDKAKVSIKSAMSNSPFALHIDASTSTSCPLIIDEWKPKELRAHRGKYETLKDVLKASYVGSDVGNRGILNRGAEHSMGVIKSKATAPIVFMAEYIETETAIFERSIVVALSQELHKGTPSRREAFDHVYANSEAVSALGRALVEAAFSIDIEAFRRELKSIEKKVEAGLPDFDNDTRKRAAPRLVYNRALILHALTIMDRVLQRYFGDEFKADIAELLGSRYGALEGDEGALTLIQGMSEISKFTNEVAMLSRIKDEPWAVEPNKHYLVGEGWLELKVEAVYEKYRRHCAAIHERPLFDNLPALVFAFHNYSSVIDRVCAKSELRDEGSSEKIVRLDLSRLRKEGVHNFRT